MIENLLDYTMKTQFAHRPFLLLAASAQLVAASAASAADGTWIQTAAGPFDWSAAATANWNGGTVADGQDSTARFTANIAATQTVNLAEARTIGNITFTDSTTDSHNLTISGANILTLDVTTGSPVINVTQSTRALTISSEIAGNDGLLKIGPGTLTLTSSSNSYTGDTTLRGGTLNLGGATADGLLASTVLNLGGGTVSYTRTGSTTQSFTTTNIQPGASTVSTVAGNTLDLGDLTRAAGGTLNFGSTGSINTSETNDSTGILGAWATFNGADWAINNGSGVAAAYTGYNTLAGAGPTLASSATTNYRVDNTSTGNVTMDATGTIDANTLRISDAAARTIDVRNGATQGILRFGAVGGLLTSGGAHIIGVAATPGTITAGGAADTTGELIVNNATALTINSVIANNGSGDVSLTKAGAGTLTLIATNSFTGDTVISGGTLVVGGNNTAATLGPANYAGNITNNGTLLQFTNSTSQNFSGVISGSGNLHKGGSGTLTLSGANTYTGKTIIAAPGAGGPTLSVSSFNSVNGGTPLLASSSLGAPTTVANGTIDLGSGTNVRSCTLIYTGAGETTDRVMNVSFNSSAKHTITSNATGGGLLKFTSNFTINPSSGTITGGLTLRGSGKGEIAQIGTIPGILEKADAGTWTVGGTNAANVVNVTTGTLIVNGSLKANNATPSINVNGTSTLGGSGTLTAATAGTAIVTVAAAAKLSPGNAAVGTLTVDGALNISAMAGGAGVMNFELDSIAASDKIVAGSVNIGTLEFDDFNFSALGGLENGTYTLIQSGGLTGSLGGTISGSVGAGTGTLQISDGGTGNNIELVVSGIGGGSPEIAIDQGGDIASGGSKDFGTVTLGSNTPLVFTIANSGTAPLNLNGMPLVAVSGSNPGDFAVTVDPTTPVSASGNTNFTVVFTPGAAGPRSAVLTIANDDSDESSFTINVSGTGQTKYQAWAGGASFDADANGDGVNNGLAFLLGAANPNTTVTLPVPTENNGDLVLTFPCLTDANRGNAKLYVEHSDDVGIGDTWLSSDFVSDSPGAAVNGVTLSVAPGSPANTVTATIDGTQATDGKLFGRLRAENP